MAAVNGPVSVTYEGRQYLVQVVAIGAYVHLRDHGRVLLHSQHTQHSRLASAGSAAQLLETLAHHIIRCHDRFRHSSH